MKHLKLFEAQVGGEPERVKLKVDLTKYDDRLVAGEEGYTVPYAYTTMYGKHYDNFVCVKFDCGSKLDVATRSLEYI